MEVLPHPFPQKMWHYNRSNVRKDLHHILTLPIDVMEARNREAYPWAPSRTVEQGKNQFQMVIVYADEESIILVGS